MYPLTYKNKIGDFDKKKQENKTVQKIKKIQQKHYMKLIQNQKWIA